MRNLFPHLLRNYESLEIRKEIEQPISSRWIRGHASQTAVGQTSVSAMEAPLHVLAQESLHQLFAMRIQEAP